MFLPIRQAADGVPGMEMDDMEGEVQVSHFAGQSASWLKMFIRS